jgi:hypothetical protein
MVKNLELLRRKEEPEKVKPSNISRHLKEVNLLIFYGALVMTHKHFTVLIRGTTSNEQKDFWKNLENTNIKKSDVLFQQDEGYSVFTINLRMSAENIISALLKTVEYIDTVSMKLNDMETIEIDIKR